MEIHPKYGGTSPVANLCKEYGIPDWVGFSIADYYIRSRYTITTASAIHYLSKDNNISSKRFTAFSDSLVEICEYVRKYQ